MAYQFVGVTAGVTEGAFPPATSPKTQAIAVHASTKAGDLLVLVTMYDHNGTNSISVNGVNWIDQLTASGLSYPATGTSPRIHMLTKNQEAGAPTSYTVTYTCTTGVMGPTRSFLLTYRNVVNLSWKTLDLAASFDTEVDAIGVPTTSKIIEKLTSTNTVGADPQLLLYGWHGGTGTGTSPGIGATDSPLVVRVSSDNGVSSIVIADEPWASASDFPQRATTFSYASGLASFVACRLIPTVSDCESSDSWAWLG